MSDASIHTDSDPRQALHALIERGEGVSATATMLRVLLLRDMHPEARITTELARIDNEMVVVRALITLGNGATGSGIAAIRPDSEADWAADVEQTETNAIARALDILGYPLRVAAQETDRSHPAPPPAPQRPQEQTAPVRERAYEPPMNESAPKVVEAVRRANQRPSAATPAHAAAPTATPEPDPNLAEFSWNAFWMKARSLGLTPDVVTQKLGRPANQMSPREAVAGLIEAGAWPNPDDEG